ncbi:hypothetical protein KAR91_64515 [Candidatus Pacearchaeota archaeon]|nr:hypothetical protein [Candidatus Pacearchaeota archaeon]
MANQGIRSQGLRRGGQDYMELMPGEESLAPTAAERRMSSASQGLLRRAEEQAKERTSLVGARLEKSELGLIAPEGDIEKTQRRQHLIRQASRHGVPQNVLAQQIMVEGVQEEKPKPTVETPYGELPADIAFRYLPTEAKPEKKPARLTDTKALKGGMKQDYESFDAGKTWKAWGEPYSAKKAVGKGRGRPKTAEYNLVNKSIVNNILAGTDIEAGGIFDAVSGTVNEGILRQRLKEGGYEDHYKAYLKIKQLSQRALRDTELVPEDTVAYAFKAAGAEHLLTGEVAIPEATGLPAGSIRGADLIEFESGKQGYEVKDSAGNIIGYDWVK